MSIAATLALLRPTIRELRAYQSARSLTIAGTVFLDANESPWQPDLEEIGEIGIAVNRYPEPQPARLLALLADIYQVRPDNCLVGRGSDDAIDVLIRSFCESGRDSILICPPTYGVYEVAARIQGAGIERVQVSENDGFAICVDAVKNAWRPGVKLVFLCSPNNPTGNSIPVETISTLAQALDGRAVVVVDEAYIEFAPSPSFVSRLGDFPNVVVLRTLSKAWALAGARCGVALGHPELIRMLQKVRSPYPLTSLQAHALSHALGARGRELCRERVRRLIEQRDRLATDLAQIDLVEKVYPSEANFLLVKTRNSRHFLDRCLRRGIVVRDRSTESGLADCVRITVGSSSENQLLLEAVGDQK